MEGLTRLVSESLARHGFDRPLDYRRLRWSRWFRCESPHSLLFVPSKPGVFALAEEIAHVATAASAVPRSEASGTPWNRISNLQFSNLRTPDAESPKPEATPAPRRMLAVTQFFEDDDMAFVLGRMLSRQNPMSARLASGRYFARFVVIEDQSQRRSICTALNQWMVSAAEKATGIGSHFATSLELTPATEYIPTPNAAQQSLFDEKHEDVARNENVARAPSPATAGTVDARVGQPLSANAETTAAHVATAASAVQRREASGPEVTLASSPPTTPQLDSGAATNIHCPSPFPSGF